MDLRKTLASTVLPYHSILITMQMPTATADKFAIGHKTLMQILNECKEQNITNSTKMVPYQYRSVKIQDYCEAEMLKFLYSFLPVGADASLVAKFCSEVVSKYYGVSIPPISGRMLTQEEAKREGIKLLTF